MPAFAQLLLNLRKAPGELIDKEEYEKKIQEEFPGEEESGIPRVIEEVRMTRLNENYLIGDDSILYDNAKKAVKELSEGRGVENIQYGAGNTGWWLKAVGIMPLTKTWKKF